MDNQKNNQSSAGGIAFVGCMFIGIAVGMILESAGVVNWNGVGGCTLAGMGLGFIVMACFRGGADFANKLTESLKEKNGRRN